MANESSFSKLLSKSFNDANAQRARIDARTAGFAADDDDQKSIWMGMSPAPGKGDGWYVFTVEEEPNKYLQQVNREERIVQITKVIGKGDEGPLSFEKAVEYLAVWEFARMSKGAVPLEKQNRAALGKHYFKDLLMKRGYLVDTTGTLAKIADIYPAQNGKFLKSDLDALEQYQDGLRGDRILNELINSHDPIFISETSIEQDLESFGEISLFDKMAFFTKVLVEYAQVKLDHVQDFYADPTRKETQTLAERLAAHPFFGQQTVDKLNETREALALSIFRYFYVDEDDWEKVLDFNSRELRKELLKNPDALEAHGYLGRKIGYPLGEEDVNAVLFTSARALVYFREMLKDSPQKDAMERKGVYKQGDIDDLLNYLDLLEIKYQYKDLAETAVALPGTQKYREMKEKTDAFKQRVANFKANLRESQELSPAMEKQIDGFVRASTPVYLLDRIAGLPEKMEKAQKYIAERLLPPPSALKDGAKPGKMPSL